MFIFDFRYDRKLGGRQEVGSPNLHKSNVVKLKKPTSLFKC